MMNERKNIPLSIALSLICGICLTQGCRSPLISRPASSEDPKLIRIDVDSRGSLFRHGIPISVDELEIIAGAQLYQLTLDDLDKFAPISVVPHKDLTFAQVWRVVTTCRSKGVWRQAFETEDSFVPFFLPVRPSSHGSPVMLAGFTGNAPPDGIDLVEITPTAVLLNGAVVNIKQLQRAFEVKPEKEKQSYVIIMPSMDSGISSVVQIMNAIASTGCRRLCLFEKEKTHNKSIQPTPL